jgi:hypothetical protein
MKTQDILTLGLLLAHAGPPMPFKDIAAGTGLSLGEAHASLRRLIKSGLVHPETRQALPLATGEFLAHGLRYVFPPNFGGQVRGLVTAGGAKPLAERFVASDQEWVWPWEDGQEMGLALEPFYASAPQACAADPALYEWMALFDALRAGRARESRFAQQEVASRLGLAAEL